jgi:lysophospholipase L1-like esterase
MTHRRTLVAGALSLTLLAAACQQGELFTPLPPNYAGGAMFTRYVSFGNSITAGFQSGGLNDSLQRLAYPVLLARAMGTKFYYPSINYVPSLNLYGCPSPITIIFTNPPTRLGPSTAPPCSLRSANIPPYLNNVAFPGADVLELLNTNYAPPQPPPSATDAYKLFLLGGRTELQRAREVLPTFVSVWIGNNDVLSAILDTGDAGQAADITPPATFATRFNAVMDSIDSFESVEGGVLLGVVQVTGAPYVSQGRAYALASASIPTMTVLPNCLAFQQLTATDTAFVEVPFHYGAPIVAKAAAGVPDTLDCSNYHVISVAEAVNMISTVAQYNAAIQQAATARGWLFLDPNVLLKALAANPANIRPFPAFPPDPNATAAPFGTAISRDGIHPSTATQKLIAQTLQGAINAFYNSAIPAIP